MREGEDVVRSSTTYVPVGSVETFARSPAGVAPPDLMGGGREGGREGAGESKMGQYRNNNALEHVWVLPLLSSPPLHLPKSLGGDFAPLPISRVRARLRGKQDRIISEESRKKRPPPSSSQIPRFSTYDTTGGGEFYFDLLFPIRKLRSC